MVILLLMVVMIISQLSDTLAPSTGSFSGFFWYQITGTSGRGGLFERRQGSPYNGWSLGQGGTSNWVAVYLMEQIIVIINFHILLQIHGIMMDLLGI